MFNFDEAWGSECMPTQVNPDALATLVVACAMNLTGARTIADQAYRAYTPQAAVLAKPFAECVEFIQRDYGENPDNIVTIIGKTGPVSVVVLSPGGDIVFDPYQFRRSSYIPDTAFIYGGVATDYPYDAGVASPVEISYNILAQITYNDAVQELKDRGLWVDNSLNWNKDSARAGDWL